MFCLPKISFTIFFLILILMLLVFFLFFKKSSLIVAGRPFSFLREWKRSHVWERVRAESELLHNIYTHCICLPALFFFLVAGGDFLFFLLLLLFFDFNTLCLFHSHWTHTSFILCLAENCSSATLNVGRGHYSKHFPCVLWQEQKMFSFEFYLSLLFPSFFFVKAMITDYETETKSDEGTGFAEYLCT